MLKPYHTYVAELRRRYAGNMKYFVMEFFEHVHQIGMMRWLFRKELRITSTGPHLLFQESDTPFTTDPIDWANVLDMLDSKRFEMLRFLFEGDIHPEHRHMAGATVNFKGMDYVETRQYSARPHVATWDFYRRALEKFSPKANCFLEDKLHGTVLDNPEAWPIGIYYPPPPRGRSFHLDGRQGDPKFDDTQIF